MQPSRKIWLGLAAALSIGLGIGALSWWRGYERGRVVHRARPVPPDCRHWPEEFQRRIAAASHDSPADLAELSRLYHANGFLREATQCYQALESLQPEEPRWPHRHATILAGFGGTEPAALRWQRVVSLAPEYVPARLRLAELLAKSERPAEASQVYLAVLQRRADEPYALLGLARIDVEAGRWEKAKARLESVVTQTSYALGHDLLVTVYDHLQQPDRAAALRGRAKASGSYQDPPDPWVDDLLDACFDAYRLSLAAGLATQRGDGVGALRLLERAVAFSPGDVAVRFQLAGLYVAGGDARRARAELERCTTLAPTFADGWAHLSALLERSGDRQAAEQVLAAGLRHAPQSPGLHLMRARQLRDSGRPVEALDAFRAAIRFRPNEADAYLELATTLFRLERVPEGLIALEQAIAAEPGHPVALALLAFHAISARNETAARKWMGAVAEQPRVPRAQAEQLLGAFREHFGRSFR